MTNVWSEFGFRENPYSTTPVPPTAEGEALLVGREQDLRRLSIRLTSTDTHPTVEGDNGVGKTSLASVAGYQALTAWKSKTSQQLLIPLSEPLQLTPDDTQQSFQRQVVLRVLSAFVEHAKLLKDAGRKVPDLGAVRRWLTEPEYKSGSATVLGVGGGGAFAPNTSSGFGEEGVLEILKGWLREAFPTASSGGFVCVLDNLKLLETSAKARSILEAVQDTVYRMQGLRWILCGARGIVRSTLSSQRLQGVLAEPLELAPLENERMPDLVAARVNAFALGSNAYAPVEADGFAHVYRVMHYNLRNSLKACQDYSVWLLEEGEKPGLAEDKKAMLETWLGLQATRHFEAAKGFTPVGWKTFDKLVELGGSSSPSDFALFGYDTPQALRPHVRNLEQANLVVSSLDDSDRRRKTTLITSAGWFVQYHRADYM